MQLDWKKGPGYQAITTIQIPKTGYHTLDNGIKVVSINQGSQDIFRVDLVFSGGRFLEHKKNISRACNALMREGTQNHSSSEIAELIDFYGASLRTSANLDYTGMSLSGLTKHYQVLITLLAEILQTPIFPDKELEKYKKSAVQRLQMDLSKNEILNYRIFTEAIFGADHAYGYNTNEEQIHSLTQEDLYRHHQEAYGTNNCFMVLGGKLKPEMIDALNAALGINNHEIIKHNAYEEPELFAHKRINVSSKNLHQASIRIGRRMFNRHHPDFAGMFVLNTILGGYFGSRLMSVIREDLGLTYHIHSMLDNLVYDGYFYIETEVTIENIEKTMEEIYRQVYLLQTEDVPEDELMMVKNYLIGNFLNLIDGPLNTISFIRSLELDGETEEGFHRFIASIRNIDAAEIKKLAQRYLNKEELIEVVVSG